KKESRVLSPTATKPSPFEGKSVSESNPSKPSSPEPNSGSDGMESDRPGTPVPAVEVPEPMEIGSSEQSDGKQNDGGSDGAPLSKKGRKRKSVSWPEESKLREYFYFELDETERGEMWAGGVGLPRKRVGANGERGSSGNGSTEKVGSCKRGGIL
ncbi:serine/threonine-protein phosphatase 1 regulatory subunit 10-like, partial [Meleagris gallopavo]|uniref:serine/threonine-protein phosphatase 1 regulatory subunit 10-like n=1 Tax=Meleagris gallopavo TaxID=9103 RepID=UPI00093ADB1A